MSQYLLDLFYSLESCLTCFQDPSLTINRNKFKILKLIGEGGFSYVYLVQSQQTGEFYALKKIRCPFGAESVKVALNEIEAYKRFDSKYVIRAVDSNIVQEKDGSKTIYILLPYYKKGNLQDKINANLVNGTSYDETELLNLFYEICQGVKAIHNRHSGASNSPDTSRFSLESSGYVRNNQVLNTDDDDDDIIIGGGDDDEESEVQLLGNEETNDTPMDTIVPYAHRDIKPANIMLSGSANTPILMDLGSCTRARLTLSTRKDALELQDLAAEHCTLPYRAPELFDVATGSSVDERVDIWSLGCTLFALMYGTSPFELQSAGSGASLNLAILNGQYKFPDTPVYSEGLKDIVRKCLTVDKDQRPFIKEVIEDLEKLIGNNNSN